MTSTELYLEPDPDEFVAHVLAHHERQRSGQSRPPTPAPRYRHEVLQTLFGAAPAGRRQGMNTAVRAVDGGTGHRAAAGHAALPAGNEAREATMTWWQTCASRHSVIERTRCCSSMPRT
ncbi:hypothetical protein ACWDKQ_32450 [Saccharopolyspora sp. NPDC000995]